MNLALFNTRSICNKTVGVLQLLSDFQTDICCITESWLRKDDKAKFAEMKDLGYSIHSKPRAGRGGGVAILYKNSIKLIPQKTVRYKSFELIESCYKSADGQLIRIATIYRSGTSSSQSANIQLFLEEFENYLSSLIDKAGKPIITGDFNIHIEDPEDSVSQRFTHVLKSNGWMQHVDSVTHKDGGTLDLIITRNDKNGPDSLNVSNFVAVDSGTSSDHQFLAFNCAISPCVASPPDPILYRKINGINISDFAEDILNSKLCDPDCFIDIDNAIKLYDTELNAILDKHAPLKTFLPKPRCEPWWTGDCQEAKTTRRKTERIFEKNKEDIEAKIKFQEASKKAASLINTTRNQYYSKKLEDCKGDSKKTYSIVNKLLDREKVSSSLPSATTPLDIANNFKTFFKDKVETIYQKIETGRSAVCQPSLSSKSYTSSIFAKFESVSDSDLVQIIKDMPSKYCDLDPLPTKILLKCLPELLPLLSFIVNKSLKLGTFPEKLKEALVRPSLKNPDLDSESLSNYRPISNLSFLSKIIEKCVSVQLTKYLEENDLFTEFQSGYRKHHSCETATTKIHSDILVMCDKRSRVVLLILDLSAAFDTVNHTCLLKKLKNMYGIQCLALEWIKSYLTDRSFCVKVKDTKSKQTILEVGVPQGSILGPLLFILYTKDLQEIAINNGLNIHLYADDTQLYCTFDPSDSVQDVEDKIKKCMEEIKAWMLVNFLQLNESKTDVIVISSKHDGSHYPTTTLDFDLTADGKPTKVEATLKSLGVILDNHLTMSDFITQTVQSCNHQIRNLWFIASKISFKLKVQLVHALVLSKLDYCNSILNGITLHDLHRLQKVQNSAVRFIFGRGKRAHVTELLKQVHFLPVDYRIRFKVCLLVYKCINNIAPCYLQDLVTVRHESKNNVRLNNDYFLLQVPSSPSYMSTEKAFVYNAPKVWNCLPYIIRSAETVDKFKTLLKTHYFKSAFALKQ